jgi:hypothetical protein
MYVQFLGRMLGCKFEHPGFEKAKERWDIASLGAKDFKSN